MSDDETKDRGIGEWIKDTVNDMDVLDVIPDDASDEFLDKLEEQIRAKFGKRLEERMRRYSPKFKATGVSVGESLLSFIMATFDNQKDFDDDHDDGVEQSRAVRDDDDIEAGLLKEGQEPAGKKEFLPGQSAADILVDKLDDSLLWPVMEPVVEGIMEILKRGDWKLQLIEKGMSSVGLGCCIPVMHAVKKIF